MVGLRVAGEGGGGKPMLKGGALEEKVFGERGRQTGSWG